MTYDVMVRNSQCVFAEAIVTTGTFEGYIAPYIA